MIRRRFDTGTPWEARVGYCRALRTGPFVFVSGTIAAMEGGAIHAPGDAAAQAEFIFDRIERALHEVGSALADVVRVRVYVTDVADLVTVGDVHGRRFADHRPTNTSVAVAGLAVPEAVVEIEADAIIDAELPISNGPSDSEAQPAT